MTTPRPLRLVSPDAVTPRPHAAARRAALDRVARDRRLAELDALADRIADERARTEAVIVRADAAYDAAHRHLFALYRRREAADLSGGQSRARHRARYRTSRWSGRVTPAGPDPRTLSVTASSRRPITPRP